MFSSPGRRRFTPAFFFWWHYWLFASWWQGEEEGRWTTRQVEPGGVEEWGGSRYFSSKRPGGIEYFQAFSQHLIWLPGRFVQWGKHWELIAEWKGKWTSGPGWEGDSLEDFCCNSTSSLSLFMLLVLPFIVRCPQYLIRGRLTWKCSCK